MARDDRPVAHDRLGVGGGRQRGVPEPRRRHRAAPRAIGVGDLDQPAGLSRGRSYGSHIAAHVDERTSQPAPAEQLESPVDPVADTDRTEVELGMSTRALRHVAVELHNGSQHRLTRLGELRSGRCGHPMPLAGEFGGQVP